MVKHVQWHFGYGPDEHYWVNAISGQKADVPTVNQRAYIGEEPVLVVMAERYSPPGHGEPSFHYKAPTYLDPMTLQPWAGKIGNPVVTVLDPNKIYRRLNDEWVEVSREELDACPNPSSPDDIRAKGWTVTVHNDYRLNGVPHTYWHFSKGHFGVKGEGQTDADALNQVREQIPKFNQ